MNDFERRLRDALAHEAEAAGDTEGLVVGARRRRAVRRRRMATAGAALAVGLIAVPLAVLGVGDGGRNPDPRPDREFSALEKQEVTCGQASWPVAAMDGGLRGVVDDSEVRAAFTRVLEEAPMDAPEEIRDEGPEDAAYITLAAGDGEYTLGTGTWTTQGPANGAQVVRLDRQGDGTLRVTGWGGCDLRVAIPEGRSPVGISAPPGRVEGGVTDPVVMVTEQECTSGRDPRPFLGEPQVVADDERVLVTMTSEALRAAATCQGNPSVPVTLHLDEPIGDRELLDGGTWPPTPIKVAPIAEVSGAGWHTVEHDGVLVDVPAGWDRLDTSSCEFAFVRFGPEGADPCGFEDEGVAFYGSATFDPAFRPGLQPEDDGGWSGYVYTGERAVNGWFDDRETGLRVLGSARQQGEEIPDLSQGWRTAKYGGLFADVPAAWVQGHLNAWCLDESVPGWIERPGMAGPDVDCVESSNGYGLLFQEGILRGTEGVYPHESGDQYPIGSWIGLGMTRSGRYVTVVAPTQALAELIVASVRPDE